MKPEPANPELRQVDLPWKNPKPNQEDPYAPGLVSAILNSPEYKPADQDVAFLRRDDARGLRLQLDFLKAETLLEDHGVAHSIVVFGSTRVPEPEVARRKAAALEAALAEDPDNLALSDRLRIARRIVDKSRYYDVAREFGRRRRNGSGAS
ncbi:hypothetical protein VQ045_20540 [Aurantimonas sp. E1-2-R+4]|uniref:hypothetical protein n=1 Tax=Aurantimonas sp. E1-2-R+4 TaxID=3113714 RepID=UPI002F95D91C